MNGTIDINKQMMIISLLIVTTVFFVYTRSFRNDVPTCNGYITNVYLYVLLALLLLAFSVLFIAKRRIPITNTKSLLAFIVAISVLFGIYMVRPESVLLNHLLWVIFILSLSVSMYVIWRYSTARGIFTSTLLITILLVAGLSLLAHLRPNLISLNWGTGLTVALLAGILAWVIPLLFGAKMSNYYKFLSAGFVVIFMLLILYDTKLLRVKAALCAQTGIPDYPKDSLGLFLDVINLFNNVSMLN